MLKKLVIAVLIVAAGTVVWWFFTPKSSENHVAASAPPLAGSIGKFTRTGAPGPEPGLSMVGAGDTHKTFKDFAGRIVLVNFWATWCAPCIREMPSLVRLQKARGGKDFTVIALSQDFQGWSAVAPFLKKHDLATLPVYVDKQTAVARAVGVKGLPTSILLDRKGHEIGRLTGDAKWDSPDALALIDHYIAAGKSG